MVHYTCFIPYTYRLKHITLELNLSQHLQSECLLFENTHNRSKIFKLNSFFKHKQGDNVTPVSLHRRVKPAPTESVAVDRK